MTTATTLAPPPGAVLVRVAVEGTEWPATLPTVPQGRLTLTIGHPDLVPTSTATLSAAGYRVVGIAADHRPVGNSVDVLVPQDLRTAHPAWWEALSDLAERVFDLRFGPVVRVLASQLELHLRTMAA